MATTDYTGRSVDLFIFKNAREGVDVRIDLRLQNQVTTGIQKLVQRFANLFLTERGSVPQQLDIGSDFLAAARLGRLRDEGDVRAEFQLAVEQVRAILDADAQARDLPDDEVFADARLASFSRDKLASKLTLRINLTSQAGTARELFLPVPLAIK